MTPEVIKARNEVERCFATPEHLMSVFHPLMERLHLLWLEQLDLHRHSEAVATSMIVLAESMNDTGRYNVDSVRAMRSGLAHDVGKAGEGALFNAPRPLTEEEKLRVQEHSFVGFYMAISSGMPREEAVAILEHHERYDGMGYPRGITGDQTSIYGRMLQICDYTDAAINRVGRSETEVLDELQRGSGTLFDPDLVNIFLKKYGVIKTEVDRITNLLPYEQIPKQGYGVQGGAVRNPIFTEKRV